MAIADYGFDEDDERVNASGQAIFHVLCPEADWNDCSEETKNLYRESAAAALSTIEQQ